MLADIQKHAGQALTDRKAMVTEIAERLNLQLSADKEQQKKELRQCKQRVSEIENLYAKLYEDLTRELIFRFVYEKAGCEKPFYRLWISSMEESAIKKGFEDLRDGHDYDPLLFRTMPGKG